MNNHIDKLMFYLDTTKKKVYAGELKRFDKNNKRKYQFKYNRKYLNFTDAIPVAVELPLTQLEYSSDSIWPSIMDRIPDPDNAAYKDYCKSVNISINEDDPFILLGKLGRKSTGSVIIEFPRGRNFDRHDLFKFRKQLGLSYRQYAEAFGFSYAAVSRAEKGDTDGRDILRISHLIRNKSMTAFDELYLNGIELPEKVVNKIKIRLHIIFALDFVCKEYESTVNISPYNSRDGHLYSSSNLAKLVHDNCDIDIDYDDFIDHFKEIMGMNNKKE